MNDNKIILDLCGGTGAWSKPYGDSGYTVINVTLPEYDVRLYIPPKNVYGILAAPPCTEFAGSGARWWESKGIKPLLGGLSIVDACLRIVWVCRPKFWALENPVGRLYKWIGKPVFYFDPCDYGDPYTKKTCLWGEFNIPFKIACEPIIKSVKGSNNPRMRFPSKMHLLPPSANREILRSITPPGFARAFYEANK